MHLTRRAGVWPVLAVLVLTATAGAQPAAAGLVVTHTQRAWHNQVTVYDFGPPLPCTDPTVYYTPTTTTSGHEYFTELSNGTSHFAYLDHGSFVTVPTNGDPTLPIYSGNFTITFVGNTNRQNIEFTNVFPVRGTGSDGSSFVANIPVHLTVNANGTTTVEWTRNLCPHGDPLG